MMNALRRRDLEIAQRGARKDARRAPADDHRPGADADLRQGPRPPLRDRQPCRGRSLAGLAAGRAASGGRRTTFMPADSERHVAARAIEAIFDGRRELTRRRKRIVVGDERADLPDRQVPAASTRRARSRRLRDLDGHHRRRRPGGCARSWPRRSGRRSRSCAPRAWRRSSAWRGAVELHDGETGEHVEPDGGRRRVPRRPAAGSIADQRGRCCAPRRRCTTSARSAIPDGILAKPGALTAAERERDGAAHADRLRAARRLRERAAAARGDDRAHPPRVLRRHRLSARPGRRARSRSRAGSSRSPTSSTPCSATAATGRPCRWTTRSK